MKQRFEALDAFRGLCAISVVIFHLHLTGALTDLPFFRGANILVEFFFVLSGFVLTHGYAFKENLHFRVFMKARFFRLYPLHLFMFLVFFVIEMGKYAAFKFVGLSFNHPAFTAGGAFTEIIPNLLLIHSWLPFANTLSFNYPSWSISIEFYLYVLLFMSIVIFKSYKVLSWVLISFIALSLIYLESTLLPSPVIRGLSCFFGGALVYIIYKKIAHFKPNYIIGSIVELALLISVVAIVSSTIEYKSLLATALFFISVLFFAFESGACSQLLKTNPLQFIGKLSFSIYMTHAAVLFALIAVSMILQKVSGFEISTMVGYERYLNFGGAGINNLVAFLFIALVIYISTFTYKYIELKGQKLNKK